MENTTVNQRIAAFRKKLHYSQGAVAEMIGMKGSTYSQMERRGTVSAERLLKLARVFDIPPEMLLYDEEEYKKLYEENEKKSITLSQEPFYKKSGFVEEFIPTNSEISLIKVFRTLNAKDKAEVREFIKKKWKKEE